MQAIQPRIGWVHRWLAVGTLMLAGNAMAQTLIPPSRSLAPVESSMFAPALPELTSQQRGIFVTPKLASANSTRTVYIRLETRGGCSFTAYVPGELDLSTLESGVVYAKPVRAIFGGGICSGVSISLGTYSYTFSVAVGGTVRVVFAPPDFDQIVATMVTTPAGNATARYDVSGMWADVATNGSGISLQHKRAAGDAAFGTWFMYDNGGASRWFSMQSGSWTSADVWEGMLIEPRGPTGTAPCTVSSVACPMRATFAIPVVPFRIRFQSSSLAFAEVFNDSGDVVFTSALRKLDL